MLWPISIAVIVVLALGLGASARREPQPRRFAPLDPPPEDETPSELALRDPVEALLRYGTPADAAPSPSRESISAPSATARRSDFPTPR